MSEVVPFYCNTASHYCPIIPSPLHLPQAIFFCQSTRTASFSKASSTTVYYHALNTIRNCSFAVCGITCRCRYPRGRRLRAGNDRGDNPKSSGTGSLHKYRISDIQIANPVSQTLIFPHINPQESSAIDQDRYEYVNSILSAVVPESELEEAQNSPGTFALIPLNERPWFEGLPADVKEYLAHMAKAEAKMAEFDEASAKVGGEPGPRFRGKGWWWA